MNAGGRTTKLLAVIGVLVVGGVVALASGGDGAPTASGACAPPAEQPLQDGSHLIGDTAPPVPYSSTPPSSGWHASGKPRTGVVDPADPLTDPELVLALETGDVVVAYDPDRTDDDAVAELTRLARTTYEGTLTTTPYAGAEAPVTFVAWGVLQSCDTVDVGALRSFVTAHAGASEGH